MQVWHDDGFVCSNARHDNAYGGEASVEIRGAMAGDTSPVF
jgi:hypothetical protein